MSNTENFTVYLLRHGHSEQNRIVETLDMPGFLLKRTSDLPLSPLGESQCESFRNQIEALKDLESMDIRREKHTPAFEFISKQASRLLASSPLKRALQTTKLCLNPHQETIHVIPEAVELAMWFSNRPDASIETIAEELDIKTHKEESIPNPSNNPALDFLKALLQLHSKHPSRTIVCTTHSLLLKQIARAFPQTDDSLSKTLVPNCGLLKLTIQAQNSVITGVDMQRVHLIADYTGTKHSRQLATNLLLYNNSLLTMVYVMLHKKYLLDVFAAKKRHRQ